MLAKPSIGEIDFLCIYVPISLAGRSLFAMSSKFDIEGSEGLNPYSMEGELEC